MEFLTRFKNALFLILVLFTQAIALAVQVRSPVDPGEPDGPSVRLIRMWALATVSPFERLAHAIGSGLHRSWSDYVDLRHVRKQNAELQRQLTRLRIEQAAIAEDALEGRRLQALLAFRQQYVASTVAAQVIGSSGSEQSRVLTIDKGWRDGLKPDMAVITPDGIVGKLRDVFPDTAQVLEINDQTSGAGVILASTRIRAILRGTVAGRMQIGNLTADSRIKPGEAVLTSGGDQVFPRGLPVGTVESIAPDPDHQPYSAIRVRPAADLDRVEEVLVITGTQSNLPALAQQDLTAAEAQHAADLSAERLPGIHDDTDGPVVPGAANAEPSSGSTTPAAPPNPNAPLVVPHPLPSLHPDRFTSGSTPPASALTPGAPIAAPVAATAQSSQSQDSQNPPSIPRKPQPQPGPAAQPDKPN
ncbi:MAG: rod shape-determining protein MreC [Acidobacteriaceae bacterium]|jgi:rod shape-determining protein MreC